MDVFSQLFSSSAVLFLLVLGVISSSHAKEICSSARDGRCVLFSGWTVVWSCAVHSFAPLFAQMEWGAFAQIAPQRASRTKEGRNFPGDVIFPYISNYVTSTALMMGFK